SFILSVKDIPSSNNSFAVTGTGLYGVKGIAITYEYFQGMTGKNYTKYGQVNDGKLDEIELSDFILSENTHSTISFTDMHDEVSDYNFYVVGSLSADMTLSTGIPFSSLYDGLNIQKSSDHDSLKFTDENDYLIISGLDTKGRSIFGTTGLQRSTVSTGDGDDVIVSQTDMDNVSLNMGSGNDMLSIQGHIWDPIIDMGEGNDNIIYSSDDTLSTAVIHGGEGFDTFTVDNKLSNINLYMSNIDGFECFDLSYSNDKQIAVFNGDSLLRNGGRVRTDNGDIFESVVLVKGNQNDAVYFQQSAGNKLEKTDITMTVDEVSYNVYSLNSSDDQLWISQEMQVAIF
ncbi:hypothetical protein ACS86V_004985, partial [Escherichia coli]